MKNFTTMKIKDTLKTLLILLIVWEVLSRIYPDIILPGPLKTLYSTIDILVSKDFLFQVWVTVKRLAIGLFFAIAIGSVLGILIGENNKVKNLFEPVFHIIQATPPISWLALGMIWFGIDGQATIFIVFIASLPILIINIVEGFENIDPKLIEMVKTFNLSKRDILFNLVLPSLKPYLKSGVTIAVGLGWKLVIMGEVLSSSIGLGAQITNARLNIETDRVLAWTIVIILLGVLSQKLIDFIFSIRGKGKHYDNGNEKCASGVWRCRSIKRFFNACR